MTLEQAAAQRVRAWPLMAEDQSVSWTYFHILLVHESRRSKPHQLDS